MLADCRLVDPSRALLAKRRGAVPPERIGNGRSALGRRVLLRYHVRCEVHAWEGLLERVAREPTIVHRRVGPVKGFTAKLVRDDRHAGVHGVLKRDQACLHRPTHRARHQQLGSRQLLRPHGRRRATGILTALCSQAGVVKGVRKLTSVVPLGGGNAATGLLARSPRVVRAFTMSYEVYLFPVG